MKIEMKKEDARDQDTGHVWRQNQDQNLVLISFSADFKAKNQVQILVSIDLSDIMCFVSIIIITVDRPVKTVVGLDVNLI